MKNYAYILMRTTAIKRHSNFNTAVKSVYNQDYPHIKLIILIDENISLNNKNSFVYDLPSNTNNIETIFYKANCGNSSSALLEIRKIFCNIANNNDVAIQLDDDDKLIGHNAISKIMNCINLSDSDICLIEYEENNKKAKSLINTQKHYSSLLREIENLHCEKDLNDIPYLCRAATMGWTKCYKRHILDKLCNMITSLDIKRNNEQRFTYGDLDTCEDFVDFSSLLLNNVRITAISTPLYNYIKQEQSVTNNLTVDSFRKDRIEFLNYIFEIYLDNIDKHFSNTNTPKLVEFIKYKLSAISSILDGRFSTYNSTKFIKEFNQKISQFKKYSISLEVANNLYSKVKQYVDKIN